MLGLAVCKQKVYVCKQTGNATSRAGAALALHVEARLASFPAAIKTYVTIHECRSSLTH